jgi:hypothetical protein
VLKLETETLELFKRIQGYLHDWSDILEEDLGTAGKPLLDNIKQVQGALDSIARLKSISAEEFALKNLMKYYGQLVVRLRTLERSHPSSYESIRDTAYEITTELYALEKKLFMEQSLLKKEMDEARKLL